VVRQPQQLRRRRLYRPPGARRDDTYTYTYGNSDPYCHSDGYSDTYRHSDSYRYNYSYTNAETDADTKGCANT
jgi:hypothetical protein